MLWSPLGMRLPEVKESSVGASAVKMAAMLWKREYLDGKSPIADKAIYRRWQKAGEEEFDRLTGAAAATPWTREYLAGGAPVKWVRRRAANVRRLLNQLQGWTGAQPVFTSWPRDGAPLAAVFCFATQDARDGMRRHLEDSGVYCPVHWPAPAESEPAMRDLAARMLTIPADQRYTPADMDRVAAIVRSWQSGS
jgi:hypothetical protein